ncbi:VOC family protein [Kitasatospora sp. NPDC049285]|uniref:VOC family protein n=1 Tax=Kitasatospora sp. NPDC049285 TaxID=3157096 RepID=UPI003419DAF6
MPSWFDISTPNSERIRGFYQELLGWTVHVLDDTYALVGGEGGTLSGGIGQAGPGSPYTGVVVYFPVDDVEAALEQAVKLGGTRRLDPVAVPGRGRIAVFDDPDGNTVGLTGP